MVDKNKKVSLNESFCFSTSFESISNTHNALKYYKEHKNSNDHWLYDSGIPIFLDTNILLNLYRISIRERNEFVSFLKKNKLRIYIPAQVQHEFLKHRVKLIKAFPKQLNKFKDEFKRSLDGYHKNRARFLEEIDEFRKELFKYEMPEASEELEKIKTFLQGIKMTPQQTDELDKLVTSFNETLKSKTEVFLQKVDLEYEDDILEAIANTNILSCLSDDENKFLRTLYDNLLVKYNEVKSDIEKKDLFAFPGCGDRHKIKDGEDPCGDFLIYHEIMKFMKSQGKDIIFLTEDVTKSDWIKSDKMPFSHYIANIFSCTGHMMYVIPYKDFIPMSFSELVNLRDTEDCIDEILVTKIPEQEEKSAESENIGAVANQSEVYDKIIKEGNRVPQILDVTKEIILLEIEATLKWAQTYGNGYISKNYLIYNTLKPKRYDYKKALLLLEELIKEGKVIMESVNIDGHKFESLKLKEDSDSDR